MGENKLYCMRCFEAMEDSSNTCPHCGWHNGDQVKNALPYGTLLGEKYLVGQAVHVNGAGIHIRRVGSQNGAEGRGA